MAQREKVAKVLTNYNFDIKLKTEQIETISVFFIDAVKDNFEVAPNWLPSHLQNNDKTVKNYYICSQCLNELGDNMFSGEKDHKT